ncbi:MAG: hypothetical protein IPP35_11835 [Elusimicrobia bacterium]|nr:hypothetical protein [Elusimicrobiota bacterium]
MDEETEKTKAHLARMGKIAAWSGWALALLSLFLGNYLLNKVHLKLMELQKENKELKLRLENTGGVHKKDVSL